jgi:hypothetical protein
MNNKSTEHLAKLRGQFLMAIEAAANEVALFQAEQLRQHAAEINRIKDDGAWGAAYRQGRSEERLRVLALLDTKLDALHRSQCSADTTALMTLRYAITDVDHDQPMKVETI